MFPGMDEFHSSTPQTPWSLQTGSVNAAARRQIVAGDNCQGRLGHQRLQKGSDFTINVYCTSPILVIMGSSKGVSPVSGMHGICASERPKTPPLFCAQDKRLYNVWDHAGVLR